MVMFLLLPLAAISTASVLRSSSGCGKAPADNTGKTTVKTITVSGTQGSYRLRIPANYDRDTAAGIVYAFGGWGNSAQSNEGYQGLNGATDPAGMITVYPEGASDYGTRGTSKGWESWNAVGSTATLPGAPECTSRTTGYCYESCSSRREGCGKCDWTTCRDDGEFVGAIMDAIEASYCVDLDHVFGTGYSNGGMMAYELGMSLTTRFAALVPGGGTPFVGHNDPPPIKGNHISVMDLHGTSDRTCPANGTSSSDGWNYEPVDNVLKVWATANGCSSVNTLTKYDTDQDGTTKLWCVSIGDCPSGVDIVRCSYNLGHHWLGYNNNGGPGAKLAVTFFNEHPMKPKAAAPRKANATVA